MMNATDRVRAALVHAGDYFTKCLQMRAGGSGLAMGSIYPRMKVETLRTAISGLEWDLYEHAEVKAPCVAFIARSFGGEEGIVAVKQLASGCEIELIDPKETGFVEGVVRNWTFPRPKVDFTVAILGPDEKGTETLYTFHPGNPVRPSRAPSKGLLGEVLTPSQAADLGLSYVKLPG
jgi:hypothetical protein